MIFSLYYLFQCRKVFSSRQFYHIYRTIALSHRLHRFAVVVERCSVDSVTKVIRWKLIIWKTLIVIRIWSIPFVSVSISFEYIKYKINGMSHPRSMPTDSSWTFFLDILSWSFPFVYIIIRNDVEIDYKAHALALVLNIQHQLGRTQRPILFISFTMYKPNCQPMLVQYSPFIIRRRRIKVLTMQPHFDFRITFYVKLFLSYATVVKRNCSADIHYYNV